jgi:hypothetical protein
VVVQGTSHVRVTGAVRINGKYQMYDGHSDPQTTLRYAQAIDVEEAIAAVDSLSLQVGESVAGKH